MVSGKKSKEKDEIQTSKSSDQKGKAKKEGKKKSTEKLRATKKLSDKDKQPAVTSKVTPKVTQELGVRVEKLTMTTQKKNKADLQEAKESQTKTKGSGNNKEEQMKNEASTSAPKKTKKKQKIADPSKRDGETCKKCKRVKRAKEYHTWGYCTHRGCTYRWCKVDDCTFTTDDVTVMVNHLHNHKEKNDSKKCFNCGGIKERPNEQAKKSGKCKDCGIRWCFIGSCNGEFYVKIALDTHQSNEHLVEKTDAGALETDALPNPPVPCSPSKIASGEKFFPTAEIARRCTHNGKFRETTYKAEQCDTCDIFSCRYENCTKQCSNSYMLQIHQKTHRKDASVDKCVNCDFVKQRDLGYGENPKYAMCPRCEIWWCLVDECNEEFESREEVWVHHFHIVKLVQ